MNDLRLIYLALWLQCSWMTRNKAIAQLQQRDRASLIDDFKGWVNLRLKFRLMGYISHHCDITQFTLIYSIIAMFTSPMARLPDMIKYRILRHQKTRSRHIKFANSILRTQTSQIIHLLVLTTSSEYLLTLAGLTRWNTLRDFKGVGHSRG